MENSVLRGSCMCGKVRFELRGSGCGSPIYSHGENRKHIVSVRCGTLDEDLPLRPSVHAYRYNNKSNGQTDYLLGETTIYPISRGRNRWHATTPRIISPRPGNTSRSPIRRRVPCRVARTTS